MAALPLALIDKIKQGRAILFLGSGALVGATIPGKIIPLGDDLRDLLNDRFLGGEYKSATLAYVADLATSQAGLFNLQDFIRDYFQHLQPADFHKKISEFNWRALFTTNYDRLVEICYEKNTRKIQEYVLVLSNQDRFDETRRTNDLVPLIKLHGCITRTHDELLPLILTIDQDNDGSKSRSRLFNHLYELATENSIIFVGHSLQDVNLRAVLLKLQQEVKQGERHYLLKPGLKDAERDFWSEKRITCLDTTFEQFIISLENAITITQRTFSLVAPLSTHPIESKFIVHLKASNSLIRYLTDHAEFISNHTTYIHHSPEDFFKGIDQGWYPIAEGLCIDRSIRKRIFQTTIERPESERKSKVELFVIKGEAGSGKTILLRKLTWDSRNLGFGIFIWVNSGTSVDNDLLQEISIKTNERIYLIWDDAARNVNEISKCFTKAVRNQLRLTIITCERFNEWHTRCDEIDQFVNGVFKLDNLNEEEIIELVNKLKINDCLGPNLLPKNDAERIQEFKNNYGAQILVALYEATMGEPFEDIIHDEYSEITPQTAKNIYLTVCTLNRMRVPVRAGLISRIHGVNFSQFSTEFFKPLERIVITEHVPRLDMHYCARHPEIAEIVFKRALNNPINRYNEYIRILQKLNISYESDRTSFRGLIRAKLLQELFPAYQDVKSIYETALISIGEDSYLLQQMANYERIRTDGSLARAIELLTKARELSPNDSSIVHSLAVVWRDRAEQTSDSTLKSHYRREARGLLEAAINQWGENSYILCTRIDLILGDLSDLLDNPDSTDRSIDELVRLAERSLLETKRMFPSDGHIYSIEARFARLLEDNKRVLKALEKAFSDNNRDPFVATRLASLYKNMGDEPKALKTLQDAVERRRHDYRLNFELAELLRGMPDLDIKQLVFYYRRAFTPGDQNHQAQFWYARYLFESEDRKERNASSQLFDKLRTARLPFEARTQIRDYLGGQGSPNIYQGKLNSKREGFGFINVDGLGERIYVKSNEVIGGLWEAVNEGDRLQFKIGFSYNGLVCCDVNAL